MIRKIVAVWVSLAMLFGFIVIMDIVIDITPTATANTLYVNTTGIGGAYTSIQDAINDSNDGDTVFVYSGTYYEIVVANKTISLIGEDRENTIINGSESGDVVTINVNWVNVTGLSMTDCGFNTLNAGIKYDNVNNCSVFACNIFNNRRYGIVLSDSSDNKIDNNNIYNNWNGLRLFSSLNNNITNNYFLNNTITLDSSSNNTLADNNFSSDGNGVYITSSANITILNNSFINTGILFEGWLIEHYNTHVIPNNNTVNGEPLLYYKNCNNINVDSEPVGQLIVANCTQLSISNLQIENTYVGIEVAFSTNLSITYNHLSNEWYGMYVVNSSEIYISNNEVIDIAYGIRVHSSTNSSFNMNNVSNNWAGFRISSSHGNYIDENYISNNTYGVYFTRSLTNIVKNNNISTNANGIFCDMSSNGNTFVNNHFTSNSGSGIYFSSSSLNNITNNQFSNNGNGIYLVHSSLHIVYHNNFINNSNQAHDETASMYDNHWNETYPIGGNYWSDFSPTCPDNYNGSGTPQTNGSSDGICDNPNYIGPNTIDYYPLKYQIDVILPDTIPPEIINIQPPDSSDISNNTPIISANYSDSSGIDTNSVVLLIDGINLSASAYVTVTGISYTFESALEEGSHTGYLEVRDIYGNLAAASWSFSIETLPSNIPSEPKNLQTYVGDSFLNLSWNPPISDGGSPIINYIIYRGEGPGEETFLAEIQNVSYYNDTDVVNGITYYYEVSAKNSYGEGLLSIEVNGTPATIPSNPTNFTVTTGDLWVNLTWNVPILNGGYPITNYTIYKGPTSGNEVFLVEIGDILYYNDTSVTNGITYYYQISAKNEIGEGLISDELMATPATIPSAPTIVSVWTGDSYVNLSWAAPSSNGGSTVTNYRIYRGMSLNSLTPLVEIGNITYYNDTDVTNGITYYYRVSAINSIDEGSLSNEGGVNATPFALVNQTPTCTITSPSPGTKISGAIVISGTTSDSDGTVQKVEIKIDNSNWIEIEGTTNWSFHLDTTSLSNGEHTLHFRAFDGINYSSEANISIRVDNPSADSDEAWLWILTIIIIVIILLLVLFYIKKGKPEKQKEEEVPK